jgi:homoserine O-acetyltransferase
LPEDHTATAKLVGAVRSFAALLVRWARAPRLQYGRIGDFPLESGETIHDCRIGYRTAGKLDAARSNAVLVLPWFQGTSMQLVDQIGAGRLVDSSRYFAIMVDALGNGVSSSPSNSPLQPGARFPHFSIRDMIESQHRLLTRVLRLDHLKAVVGVSMGGMQVFEWITSHPDFMDRAVSIVGSPQTQPDDRERWERVIGNMQQRRPWKRTITALVRGRLRTACGELIVHADDTVRQAQAGMALDIPSSFGGSMTRAAASVRARLLVVGTMKDEEVNPKPGFEFARLARADVFELRGDCGHQAPSCERATMWPVVSGFLAS